MSRASLYAFIWRTPKTLKTMSNDLKSIHDFDFTMICNYFKLLERQGPGSPEVTQKP